MTSPDLSGKAALVTGGGSGIGLACARALARRGARVAVAGRTAARLDAAAADLGGEALAIPADVSDADAAAGAVAATVERFGRLDVLVNNAGIGGRGRVADLDPADFDRVLATNLRGPFLCARAAWPHLAATGDGWVFNVASFAGKKGMAGAGAYCASKFGLLGLSEAMSEEGQADGIRAAALCPGYVATPMVAGASVPPAEMLQPEDIAATMLWLLGLSRPAVVKEVVLTRTGA